MYAAPHNAASLNGQHGCPFFAPAPLMWWRTLARLSGALDRHGKSQRQITVKHVTVNAEQAVVADTVVGGTLRPSLGAGHWSTECYPLIQRCLTRCTKYS